MSLLTIILAAGKGTRMKSENPKVLFEAAGRPMVDYAVSAAREAGANEINVVVGSGAELVKAHLGNSVTYSVQKEQRGTGDAVMAAEEIIKDKKCRVLILCGDMPLVSGATLRNFVEEAEHHPVSFITVDVEKPFGYGRVVRGTNGNVLRIVEQKDANENEKRIKEINTGIYLCDGDTLLDRLSRIDTKNAQGEFYLTDIVSEGAYAYKAEDEDEFMGVNTRAHLAAASKMIWRRRAERFMEEGVSILDPDTFYAGADVEIKKDAVIYPNVYIEGETIIHSGTTIYPGSRIKDSVIEENCEIKDNTLIQDSFVGKGSSVGPMAQLRPGTKLLGENKIGNFVETKKISFGEGSKASHLTYLGDADIGKDVNVGCGTITCNYDGINKHVTTIGDGVFVGSDVQFVAPVNIGKGALIGAGSTITKDVPEDSLAITRAKQLIKEGWVSSWKKSKEKK
ncbi:bifunctional UDP-N-acetylglucosamine diphosphorylase/glucosamine-1-phosphate N-acetyltransferase GlmU [Limisalsivibrio acetivorans]|uniref:bifunctional UDP-N-acetylglucosamine diphosphorylase/glucosamine-1-phosphate N-acetyltransferase GlmU n=1 Tax=Limisalsivibrio acetivorans TaxID=1304888 RepID=UPI0003B5CAA6|nr:bifunctional UDP-N-acetylglucosamine diphosphorylase/glucosamine-1-phosphate N-acetyltransferase GlmU [Limisalsivibrio acetivorans]